MLSPSQSHLLSTHNKCSILHFINDKSITICPSPIGEGHYEMMACLSVCLSVHQSDACLDLTQEQTGLGSAKLVGWKPVNLFRGQKVKGQGHLAD